MRLRVLPRMAIGITMLVAPAINTPNPLVTWNASPSVPVGLYLAVRALPRPGDLALARLPPNVADLAARRGYLPRPVLLLKPVVAVAGDQVCRLGDRIFVNGRFMALALLADALGQPLPVWHGCRTLTAGEVFLLAEDPRSFDSRYFGPLDHEHIIGGAFLTW